MSQKFTLDLSKYKDRFGAKVEEGQYHVIVEDAELDKSKAGNTMVNVWFRIMSGEYKGSTITDRLTVTEKALFRVVNFMQAIGLPTPKKRLQIDIQSFLNKQLLIEVSDGEPYNGTVRSEVRSYERLAKAKAAAEVEEIDSEDEDEATEDDALNQFPDDEEYEDEIDEEPEPTPVAKKRPAKAEPEDEGEDDSPEEIDLEDIDLA